MFWVYTASVFRFGNLVRLIIFYVGSSGKMRFGYFIIRCIRRCGGFVLRGELGLDLVSNSHVGCDGVESNRKRDGNQLRELIDDQM